MDLINIVDLLLYAVNVVILFFVVRHFVHKPVSNYLDARKKKVTDELNEAARVSREAKARAAEYKKLIQNSNVEVESLLAKGKSSAKKQKAEIIAGAKLEAQEILARAVAESENERRLACESARTDITEMAVQIAERILQREVSPEDNKKVIDDFFDRAV